MDDQLKKLKKENHRLQIATLVIQVLVLISVICQLVLVMLEH